MTRMLIISSNNKPIGRFFQDWLFQHFRIRAKCRLLKNSLGLSLMISKSLLQLHMSHPSRTTSKGWKKVCVKEKGLEEKTSFSLNEGNPSRKPSADCPCAWLARTGSQAYPKTKTKGDRVAMAGLHQSAFIPWGWHVALYPSPTPKRIGFCWQEGRGMKPSTWVCFTTLVVSWMGALSLLLWSGPKNNLDPQECQESQSPRDL